MVLGVAGSAENRYFDGRGFLLVGIRFVPGSAGACEGRIHDGVVLPVRELRQRWLQAR
jgi:hypothetical protein